MGNKLSYNPYQMDRMSVDEIHAMGSVVYFFFAEDELIYIGQSTNFKHRMKMHRVRFEKEAELTGDDRLKDLSFTAIAVPPSDLNEVEYYYIQKYLPPYNKDYLPEEIARAYRAVRIAKMELVMAQLDLEDVMSEYHRKIAAEHKTEEGKQ